MNKGKTLLTWASLFLFIFSICELAFALTAILASNVVSFESTTGIIKDLFLTSSQNAGMVALDGALGAVAGFVGLIMTRSKASAITYYRFAMMTYLLFIIETVIILSQTAEFPWIRLVLFIAISALFLFGAYQYHLPE